MCNSQVPYQIYVVVVLISLLSIWTFGFEVLFDGLQSGIQNLQLCGRHVICV